VKNTLLQCKFDLIQGCNKVVVVVDVVVVAARRIFNSLHGVWTISG